jgi:hypothetical protein
MTFDVLSMYKLSFPARLKISSVHSFLFSSVDSIRNRISKFKIGGFFEMGSRKANDPKRKGIIIIRTAQWMLPKQHANKPSKPSLKSV